MAFLFHDIVLDDTAFKTASDVPYDELPESEKEYDRNTAIETLKLIIKLGYKITRKDMGT